jgi:hypothetical protein
LEQITAKSFLDMTDTCWSFLRKYLPNIKIWRTIACQLFFQIKSVPWKKWPVQLETQQLNYFSLRRSATILCYTAEALSGSTIVSHRTLFSKAEI